MKSPLFYYLGLLAIVILILMIFIKPSGYPYRPSPHPYPKSFTCDEVREQMLKEACAKAELIIQKDEKLKEMLAGKEFEIEIGGSYLPEETEKLRIGAAIRFDREYSFMIDGNMVKTKMLLVEIDLKNEKIVRVEYNTNTLSKALKG